MSVYTRGVPERQVPCVHCGAVLRLSPAARSTTCSHCYRGMTFEDVVVDGEWAGKIATGGSVVVKASGRASARLVEAALDITILGHAEGTIHTRGTLRVGPKAQARGHFRAAAIEVESGGTLEGEVRVGA